MNRTYYTKNIEAFNDDTFVYLRNVCLEGREIAMCYNVATNKTWREIFNIHSLDDISLRLKTVYTNLNGGYACHGQGWGTDQIHLYKAVMEWHDKTNNFICLSDYNTGFSRLDRCDSFSVNISDHLQRLIQAGAYSDYHCLRPYSKYSISNENIYNIL